MARSLLLLTLLALAQRESSPAPTLRSLVGADFTVRIVRVADGDTVDALPLGEKRSIRLRLFGIDAPERNESFSAQATRFTRILLLDKQARAGGQDVDRYGRLVVTLRVGDIDASEALLQAGLACHLTAYSSDASFARAETDARQAQRGFWAPTAVKPKCVSNARRDSGGAANSTQDQGSVHGNADSRVYHTASCPNFNCRKCTRVFASAAAARAAGFRPAGDCH